MEKRYFSGTGEWDCPKCGTRAKGRNCPKCRFCIYAGFWVRLISTLADKGVIIGLGFLFTLSRNYSQSYFALVTVLSYLLLRVYCIVLVALWGQTPGKALVKIKVVNAQGGPIGWGRALLRNSVEAIISLWFLTLELGIIDHIPSAEFSAIPIADRGEFIARHLPATAHIVNYVLMAFVYSEFVVIFLNKRKRAIHDFLAGTVVVHDPNLPFLPWMKPKA